MPRKFVIRIGSLLAVLLVAGIVWGPSLLFGLGLRLAAYSGATYAVYLDSGHIFYGSLRSISGNTVVLANVRSFQKFAVGQETTNTLQAQTDNPITRPENFLVLERSNILFIEKVGPRAPILSTGVSGQ